MNGQAGWAHTQGLYVRHSNIFTHVSLLCRVIFLHLMGPDLGRRVSLSSVDTLWTMARPTPQYVTCAAIQTLRRR